MPKRPTPEQIKAADRIAHKHAAAFNGHTPVDVPGVKAPERIEEEVVEVQADPRRALRPKEKPDKV